jgi:molybdate/tungstate transport system ATP-binding protein
MLKLKIKKNFPCFSLEINFEVPRFLYTVLLGPSGSGKSLTLKLIAGFEKPDKGFIYCDEKEITFLPPEKRNIAYLPQSLALFPHLTVKEHLLYPFKCQKKEIDERLFEEIIKKFEIKELLDKKPGCLSGGEKQRVALARAILSKPKILLLDEPLSSLDFHLKIKLAGFLKEIKNVFKLTVIHVTHDPVEALLLAEKIFVIEKGRFVWQGNTQEILENKNIFLNSEVLKEFYKIAKIFSNLQSV